MTFYLCPFNSRIRRLFAGAPHLLNRPRIPIAKRAEFARQKQGISEEMARQCLGQKQFLLGTNQFSLENFHGFKHHELLVATLLHISSITENAYIQIHSKNRSKNHPELVITIHSKDPGLDQNIFVQLEFQLFQDQDRVILYYLQGSNNGYSGQALAALYNIARDIGIGRIYFYIKPRNINAKRFYFHMDFGKPPYSSWNWWEVKVK